MVSIGSKDDCRAYVDVNFYQYLRKQLSTEETAQLEAHTKVCMHCLRRAGLFSEALTNQTSLNTNEKIFFLTFFESELWEIISTELKEEFLSEIQATISKQLKQEIADELRAEIRKDIEKNIELITKEENVKKIEETTTQHWLSRIPRLSPVRQIIVGAIIATLITGLGLAIFSLFEQRENLTKPAIKYYPINPNGNLYKELDDSIDKFLDTNDQSFLEMAQQTATQIKNKHKDNYGVDLVDYYQALESTQTYKLLSLRKDLQSLTENTLKQQPSYEDFLARVDKLQQEFLLAGNLIEAYKAKILLIKYCVLTSDCDRSKSLISDSMSWAVAGDYHFLRLQILLWKAKDVKEDNPQLQLENVIELARQLNNTEAQISASTSLAAIYVNQNNNEKALNLIESILELKPVRYTQEATLLQIRGMAHFNLKNYKMAREYIQAAIKISEENQDTFLAALSYSFLGTLLSQTGEHAESENILAKANDITKLIKVPNHKAELTSRIVGYQAKNEFLQGKYTNAITLYEKSINIMKSSKLNNEMELAELNQSLGIALKKIGNKKYLQHEQIAAYHFSRVVEQKDNFSCILSLMPICN